MQAYIDEFIQRGRKGAEWLTRQVDEMGNLPDPGELGNAYKCVIPLRLAGHATTAALVLQRIMEIFCTETGDLRNSPEVKTAGSYTSHFCQIYPNGWVIYGALLLGRFDVMRTLMQGLVDEYYNQELGTFRSIAKPRLEQDEFDIVSAAFAAELFIVNDMRKAIRAGEFMLRHLAGQPDLNNYYYTRVDSNFQYLTQPRRDHETYSFYKIGAEGQAQWFLGFPCGVLALLYQATNDKRYLEGAERFHEIYRSSGDAVFHAYGSSKAMWASSVLYRLTGDEVYLQTIKKLADFFFTLQTEEGLFEPVGDLPGFKNGMSLWLDMTPDYTRWFLEAAAELTVACKLSPVLK